MFVRGTQGTTPHAPPFTAFVLLSADLILGVLYIINSFSSPNSALIAASLLHALPCQQLFFLLHTLPFPLSNGRPMGTSKSEVSLVLVHHTKARVAPADPGSGRCWKDHFLCKLKFDNFVTTIPTVGFNVESITYKNLTCTMWDSCGSCDIRRQWRLFCRHYLSG